MAIRKHSVKLPEDVVDALMQWAAPVDPQNLSEAIRLAIVSGMQRKPPKKLPDWIRPPSGNPDPAAAGQAGAASRWGQKKQQRRRKPKKAAAAAPKRSSTTRPKQRSAADAGSSTKRRKKKTAAQSAAPF